MKEFTIKEMSDLLFEILSEIKDDGENKTAVMIDKPLENSIFPCRVINTPLETTIKTKDAVPILKTFKVIIEEWASDQVTAMEMASKTDSELRKKNFVKTNTNQIVFDETIKKYKLANTYEVRWEGITNSFVFIN